MDEQQIKQLIRQAIFNAHKTRGNQAPGDHFWVGMDVKHSD